MKSKLTSSKITLIYLLFGITWIYISDKVLLLFVPDLELFAVYQSYKGYFYIAFTGLFLFALTRSYFFELEKSHKQLNESLEQISNIANSMIEGVLIVDLENQSFLYTNKTMQDMIQFSEKEINNFNFRIDQGETSLGKLFLTLKETLTRKIENSYELPILKKDDSIMHADLSIKEIVYEDKKCLLTVFHDVSDKVRLQTQITKERYFVKSIQGVCGTISLTLNEEQEVTAINKGGCEMLGYLESEILGKNWGDNFLPERIREEVKNYLKSLFKEEANLNPYKESLILNQRGEEREVLWHSIVLKDELDNIYACMCSGLDITNKKKIERTVEELKEYNEKLKELDNLKSLFIASMSHELRTPLNSIIGFSSIILDEWLGPVNEKQRENLSLVLNSGKYLLSLINEIIDVAKIEEGTIELNLEELELKELIQELVKNISLEVEKRGLLLKLNLNPIIITTERKRLTQSLYNLMSNALKFTEIGYVEISNLNHQDFVEISVEDTGMGMSPEEISKLFTPFTRFTGISGRRTSGVGLGLYLTKKIIEDILQGKLLVESEKNKGSKFTIILPIKLSAEKDEETRV